MYVEIQAKTLLATVPGDDKIFGLKYNLNLYRGCEHQCIYCDSRSECYGIENFRDVLVKINAIELLEKELARKRIKGTVGFGSMSDPYTRAELTYGLTHRALEVLARRGFPAHLITKSDLILRDIDLLAEVNRVHASVCFSLSTVDDALARKVEPGAPLPSARLEAMRRLAERGIHTGAAMMPILPFLEDNPENIRAIVAAVAAHGGTFIAPWFGMSLRDRQRDYYYEQLDRQFPGVRAQYERRFGLRYEAPANRARELSQLFNRLCVEHSIATCVKRYEPPRQLGLFA
jgi:DNA repair photolyase